MMQGKAERLTKVKAKAGKWTIGWEKMSESTGTYDSYEINSRDMPNDDLPKRLQVMSNHVADICELPPGAAKKIVVSGVSVSYTEDNCYVVITAQKALINSKSPLLINTPARPLYPGEDEDDSYCMSEELYDDLIILEKEALKYVRGERAQQVLDLCQGDEPGSVKLDWTSRARFERIRRITGYLVGTLDKWNDAKQAEERDRVIHTGRNKA